MSKEDTVTEEGVSSSATDCRHRLSICEIEDSRDCIPDSSMLLQC